MPPEIPHDGATRAEPTTPATPDPAIRRARDIALLSVLGLVATGLAWELWLAPTGSGTWAIKVVPLLFCIGGLLRHRLYTFRWLSLLVWLYALEALTRVIVETGPSQALAVLQLALSLALFTACAMYVRWRLRNGRRVAPEPPAEAAAP